jgi:PAS domain S-box-containing protein
MSEQSANTATGMEQLQRTNEQLRAEIAELKRVCQDRDAFEYTGTAMMVIEEDMTISMGNQKMAEITGYSRDILRTPKKWTDYVAEEDLPRMLEYHRGRREDSFTAPTAYEFRMKHADGGIRHVLINVNLIPGTRKSIISLIDITDRRRAEDDLRKSEQRYRDLFENANDIIYMHDLGGTFITANAAALKTYGFTREELPSVNIRDIIDPAYLPLALEKIQPGSNGTGDPTPFELLTYTRQRAPVWVEVRLRIVMGDNGPKAIQGIARDITERRTTLEALRQSEERFKETAEMLPGVICEVGADRRFTYVNQMGLRCFGYASEDVERGLRIDEVVDESFLPRMHERFAGAFTSGVQESLEYLMKHKDGTRRFYTVSAAPIIRDGRPVGLRTCLFDTHDKHVAVQKIAESEERFRGIFDGSPIGIALGDRDGACLEANESFRAMFGLQGKLASVSLLKLAGLAEPQRQAVLRGEAIHLDGEDTVAKTGAPRYLEWLVTPLGGADEERTGVLVQVQDVTDRKLAERSRLDEARAAADEARRMLADMRRDMVQSHTCLDMVSRSDRMRDVFEMLPQIADTPATVLVCGESGTGKELIARGIHDMSSRKEQPFIAINCSALPDTLLESELFGYKAGAFTDAKKDKPGKFAQAEKGTLFLDEIGDISGAMQVKLLRVLQERVYEPLGGTQPVKADVRIVAATNRDLPVMVKEGKFREDLYYRIKVLQILLPPLRDRRSDIPLLCEHFIERFNARYGKEVRGLSQEALETLLAHHYPGNIRELENIIEHAFIFCKGEHIEPSHLPADLRATPVADPQSALSAVRNFDDLEKLYIESVLAETGGNKLKAARKLGVHKATLFRKIKRLGIIGAGNGGDDEE